MGSLCGDDHIRSICYNDDGEERIRIDEKEAIFM